MKFLIKSLKGYLVPTFTSVVLVFIYTIAELQLPNIMSRIINEGVITGDIPQIIRLGTVMLTISLLAVVVNVTSGFFASRVSAGVGTSLRAKVFRRVESFSLAEIDKFGTASLITRTTNDINQVQSTVMMMLRIVIMAPFMAIGGIILAYKKSPALSNIIFLAVPVLLIVVIFVAGRAMPLSKKMQLKIDKVNLVMREKLTGLRVLRAFGTEDYEQKRFDMANNDLTQTSMTLNRTFAILMPGLMITLNFASIAIVWFGSLQASYGGLKVGDIMAMVQYLMQIMFAFTMMSFIFINLPRAFASAQRIDEVISTENSVRDLVDNNVITETRGSLEFRNVSFRYPGADKPAIQNVSFKACPGQTLAIIGSTGSGKSTILNLIARLYDATEGEILVNDVEVKEMPLKQLRSKLGFVPQKSVLFRGTIASNLHWGNPEADSLQMEKAAEIAQAADFIQSKDGEYRASVSQGGSNFSGGQKQRLSIARAVIRNPEIYIFDDSFSALDFATDAKLRRALSEETGGATVVIVAQRVSTIMNADKIVVLDDGMVAGIGKHKELYKNCKVYREIVASQLSQEEVGA